MCLSDMIDSIDSPGGHILALLGILFSAATVSAMALPVPKTEDIIVGTFGALLAKLSGLRSNAERKNGHANGHQPASIKPLAPLSLG